MKIWNQEVPGLELFKVFVKSTNSSPIISAVKTPT